ncbi:YdbL family protein [Limibacillus sp. MBR-115]|jgi:uncharacterized protein YdbL (DUF1318 family)|uniref:YdbL family protein n=1 Tax=Limibacillus sp. MBR-115 TaxID=3156465 RepID=UPI003395E4C1
MRNGTFTSRRKFLLFGGLAIAASTLGLTYTFKKAKADQLDDLRKSGAVGERFDGLLVVRDSGNASANSVAAQVNAQRKEIYASRAAQQGVTAEEVGKVYAAQILQKAPAGTWFQRADGSWVQK